jgi:hypothetical protein
LNGAKRKSETKTTFQNAQTVFIQPVSSDLSTKRIALATPVAQLSSLLKQLDEEKIKVEHVFDY